MLFMGIYPLVMTNSSPWKDPPFLIGKPSISMGHFPWQTVKYEAAQMYANVGLEWHGFAIWFIYVYVFDFQLLGDDHRLS